MNHACVLLAPQEGRHQPYNNSSEHDRCQLPAFRRSLVCLHSDVLKHLLTRVTDVSRPPWCAWHAMDAPRFKRHRTALKREAWRAMEPPPRQCHHISSVVSFSKAVSHTCHRGLLCSSVTARNRAQRLLLLKVARRLPCLPKCLLISELLKTWAMTGLRVRKQRRRRR